MVPVVQTDRPRRMSVEPRPRNPVLIRTSLMVGALLVLVPVGLNLRGDEPFVQADAIQGVDTVMVGRLPAPAPTQATLAPSTSAPTTLLAVVAPTPAPTEAVVVTPAPTDPPTVPPTTAAPVQKKAAPKSTTTQAPTPTVVQAADSACALTYTIVSGDAWSSIASRAKVTMKALLAANNATVNTMLMPGKTLCLPTGAVAPGPPTTKPPSTTQPPATTQPKPTPTTKPTNPPVTTAPGTTQPPPPVNTYTKAQVAQIIRDVWPDDLEDEAIRIATRESNLIPTVRNSCCYGLFQIYYTAHRTWLASIGVTSAAQLYDPRVNASAALALYYNSGWAPWGTSPTTTTVA
jgi:LysM repeat protein